MISSRLIIEQFSAGNNLLSRTAALLILLSVASLPVMAQDICSREGRSKMEAANVSEAQIARICPEATAQATTSVPLVEIDDLRIDMASMGGRKIRVRGIGQYVMNVFMLKKNISDMSPILVDIAKLERDQQRRIFQQCADIMTGCNVIISGAVGKVSYQNGIVAEKIEW